MNREPLVQGPVSQISWVVADLDAAEQLITQQLGVAKWLRIQGVRFRGDTTTLRGAPADYVINISIGYAGTQQLELIEPVEGASLYAEHLAQHGPGLHHVAWIVDDLGAVVAEAARRGLPELQAGSTSRGTSFSHLDGGPLGTPLEMMQLGPETRQLYADYFR